MPAAAEFAEEPRDIDSDDGNSDGEASDIFVEEDDFEGGRFANVPEAVSFWRDLVKQHRGAGKGPPPPGLDRTARWPARWCAASPDRLRRSAGRA